MFWRDFHADGRSLSALEVALLVEAVRLMSRADLLDKELGAVAGIGSPEWRVLTVEARQTATALKGVVAELRQHNAGGRALAGGGPGGSETVEIPKVVSAVDQLSARRSARRAEAAGGVVPGGEQ